MEAPQKIDLPLDGEGGPFCVAKWWMRCLMKTQFQLTLNFIPCNGGSKPPPYGVFCNFFGCLNFPQDLACLLRLRNAFPVSKTPPPKGEDIATVGTFPTAKEARSGVKNSPSEVCSGYYPKFQTNLKKRKSSAFPFFIYLFRSVTVQSDGISKIICPMLSART